MKRTEADRERIAQELVEFYNTDPLFAKIINTETHEDGMDVVAQTESKIALKIIADAIFTAYDNADPRAQSNYDQSAQRLYIAPYRTVRDATSACADAKTHADLFTIGQGVAQAIDLTVKREGFMALAAIFSGMKPPPGVFPPKFAIQAAYLGFVEHMAPKSPDPHAFVAIHASPEKVEERSAFFYETFTAIVMASAIQNLSPAYAEAVERVQRESPGELPANDFITTFARSINRGK